MIELTWPAIATFVILPPFYRVEQKDRFRFSSVDVLALDGSTKRTAVWQCTQGAILRLDARGNIYLADTVKPPGRAYPEFFDGKLEPPPATSSAAGDRFWYSYMYGSIVKFPASGGVIWYDRERRLSPSVEGEPPAELLAQPALKLQAHLGYSTQSPAEVQGAEHVPFVVGTHQRGHCHHLFLRFLLV